MHDWDALDGLDENDKVYGRKIGLSLIELHPRSSV